MVEESPQRMNKGKFEKSVDVAHVYNPRFPWDADTNHFKSFRGLAHERKRAIQFYSLSTLQCSFSRRLKLKLYKEVSNLIFFTCIWES